MTLNHKSTFYSNFISQSPARSLEMRGISHVEESLKLSQGPQIGLNVLICFMQANERINIYASWEQLLTAFITTGNSSTVISGLLNLHIFTPVSVF